MKVHTDNIQTMRRQLWALIDDWRQQGFSEDEAAAVVALLLRKLIEDAEASVRKMQEEADKVRRGMAEAGLSPEFLEEENEDGHKNG